MRRSIRCLEHLARARTLAGMLVSMRPMNAAPVRDTKLTSFSESVADGGRELMDRTALHAFMRQHRYGVVSSISAGGAPQSALVGIATTQDLEIVFDTVQSSRKYPNLIARPACSFVVGWAGEQTVQFEGTATEPKGPELKRYQQMHFRVWPEGPARMSWPGIAYFVVRPRWIRYSDYDQSPPLIEEFTF